MDPCIVDYSVEIPTRCRSVIEFIIPRIFLNAQHVSSGTPLIIRSLSCPLNLGNGRSQYGHIKPEAADTVLELLMMNGVPLETC